jgi:hypothetical protein
MTTTIARLAPQGRAMTEPGAKPRKCQTFIKVWRSVESLGYHRRFPRNPACVIRLLP